MVSGVPPRRAAVFVCRGGDLDSRPRAYESPALPLSYLGVGGAGQILLWVKRFVNTQRKNHTEIMYYAFEIRESAIRDLTEYNSAHEDPRPQQRFDGTFGDSTSAASQ